MIWIFTFIAKSLLKTLESFKTLCSVNANGNLRRPFHLEVVICDFRISNSAIVTLNIMMERISCLCRTSPEVAYQLNKSLMSVTRGRGYTCLSCELSSYHSWHLPRYFIRSIFHFVATIIW
jgi:hypothetical protein